jgi:transposase InsO family protein
MLDRLIASEKRQADLLPLVLQIRADHPTLSCRAMYYKLKPEGMGRDTFERFCRQQGLTQERCRLRPQTTNSSGVIRFPNLLIGLVVSHINEVWSSDITYYEVEGYYCYITFVMDCYSRRILGYQVSKRLSTEHTTLAALRMAVEGRGGQVPEGLIFHSDGGGQYYDKSFVAFTQSHKMRNSMCVWPWENDKAERLNGIIKNNYLRHWAINTYEQLKRQVSRAVRLYNEDRPHKSLGYRIPASFEQQKVYLGGQTKPKMTGSLDAEPTCEGAKALPQVGQTKPQNQGILSAGP